VRANACGKGVTQETKKKINAGLQEIEFQGMGPCKDVFWYFDFRKDDDTDARNFSAQSFDEGFDTVAGVYFTVWLGSSKACLGGVLG
jgi:hypothetical protein